MPTIAGSNITKAAHDNIVKAVLDRADEQGYCEEVEDFLENLGFTLPEAKPVTVTLTVSMTPESVRGVDLTEQWNWNIGHDYGTVDLVNVEVQK